MARRVIVGGTVGLFVAAVFSTLAALVWLWNGRSFGWLDVNLSQVVLVYLLWGPFVGVVVGVAFPLTRFRIGAAGVGAFVMGAAYLMYAIISGSSTLVQLLVIPLGLIVGAIAGLIVFGRYWSEPTSAGGAPDDNA